MFDIGAAELLVIVMVAVIVIGPSDMPKALRKAGSWIGKVRRVSAHFRSGINAMVREAELEEMETKWRAQNEEIMSQTNARTDQEDLNKAKPHAGLSGNHEIKSPKGADTSKDNS